MDINLEAPAIASSETYVNAPLSSVWAVHTDIRAWPEWNSEITFVDLSGPLLPGTQFRWKSGGVWITSVLQVVEPEQQIVWTGRAPLGIRAIHTWTFEPQGEATRVLTEESFEGLLVRIFKSLMRQMLARSLEKGITALKMESERRVQGSSA